MRVLIDINHPAHVHVFRNPIRILKEQGHEILVTSRAKEVTLPLLDELGIEHIPLTSLGSRGMSSLVRELFQRNYKLLNVARRFKPDVMAAVGGTFVAHVGTLMRVPSVVFYDTDNATLQNAITYPFASKVVVPRCYRGWLPKSRSERYAGYHELSYLHPTYFTPDRNIAIENGLAAAGDTFLLRLVSWQANHDIGKHGWSMELLANILHELEPRGRVLISSELPLPEQFQNNLYRGNTAQIHHVMAHCRAYIGEGATMASESAVLGVPTIYTAADRLSYTDEQETKYGLLRHVTRLESQPIKSAIDWALTTPPEAWQRARQTLLEDTVDVAALIVDQITSMR